jgi:hypothetical protein
MKLKSLIEKQRRILKNAIEFNANPKKKEVVQAERILKKDSVRLRDFKYARPYQNLMN